MADSGVLNSSTQRDGSCPHDYARSGGAVRAGVAIQGALQRRCSTAFPALPRHPLLGPLTCVAKPYCCASSCATARRSLGIADRRCLREGGGGTANTPPPQPDKLQFTGTAHLLVDRSARNAENARSNCSTNAGCCCAVVRSSPEYTGILHGGRQAAHIAAGQHSISPAGHFT